MRVPIRDRVEEFIGPPDVNGCRRWLASTNSEGRGNFVGHNGKLKLVTRYLLQKKLNRELLPEELACHTCDHPWCCTEAHLWVGSDKENSADRGRKQRQHRPKGELNPKCTLTPEDVLKIRADTRKHKDIVKDYPVTIHGVRKIKQRITWRHI